VRTFVTGGTGFIGEHLVRKLRERGDDVSALVRSPQKSAPLRELEVELVPGDTSDAALLRTAMAGSDAVYHVAGVYRIGIPASERAAMYQANVVGTERVLDAAAETGIERSVYVSTVNVFGNTQGRVVDETYRRQAGQYLSYYDETKFLAHQAALERVAGGAPVVIVQPGGVYGPNDHSEIGRFIVQMQTGKLRMLSFPELGFNFVHVDDVVDGIVLAHDKGRIGESYVLGGEITTLGDVIAKVAEIVGRKPPRFTLPAALARMAVPAGPLVGRLMGQPPNLRELISAADGVTYWATDAKARRELGYAPRDLDTGLRQTLAAAGWPQPALGT
jgi:dihydroflavonol-4-reductase